jgi:anti-sigma-K factor RskA
MSRPDETELRDLAAAYALGALDADDARAFEAALATSPELTHEVAELREAAALIAAGTTGAPAAPPAELRARVLATTPTRPAAPPAGPPTPISEAPAARRRRLGHAVPWVALAASVAGLVWLAGERGTLADRLAERDSALAAQGALLAARESRLAARESTLNAILEPGVELHRLTTTAESAPVIQLFVDRGRGSVILHAFRLPPAPAGRTYQLWFMRDGVPVPSATFDSEPTGHALVQRIELPAGALAAAITEEPAGGSPRPTSPPFLLGSLQPAS